MSRIFMNLPRIKLEVELARTKLNILTSYCVLCDLWVNLQQKQSHCRCECRSEGTKDLQVNAHRKEMAHLYFMTLVCRPTGRER